ncbi:hypothetical protein BJ741DRAFT_707451 [Chytriomyces cf. hyalinus JEL632]|nr:hypothetical protein BJ741DRAFT_707451 [Chytriomyces cf. hyalinus JEL632]
MWSSEPPPNDKEWPMASSPLPQLSTLRPTYTYPVYSAAHPSSYLINMLSETSSVSSNDSCQMDVTCLQRLHLDDVDKRPFPSILPLVQPMETLHEELFSLKDDMKHDLDLTQFWVGSAPPSSAAVAPNNHSHNSFFFNVISPSPVTSPIMSPYAPLSGGGGGGGGGETLFHEPRLSLSSPIYSGQPLQPTPNKTIQHRDSLQTLSKGGNNRNSPISHNARLLSDESLVKMESEENGEKYSTWKRMFKKRTVLRKDTIGSRESASTLNSLNATLLNRGVLVDRLVEASEEKAAEEKTPKGFKRFLKKTAAFFRSSSSSSKTQKKEATVVVLESKPDSNVCTNSALSLSSDSKPSASTKSSSKKDSNKSSAKTTQPQSITTPRKKSPFSSIDFESRDQARLKSIVDTTSPIVSTETMESLDRGRITWKLLCTSNQLKPECLYASVLSKNENLLCASYHSSLLRPSNASSSCATGGCGCGSLRDYYASSVDGGSQNASMDRGTATDSGIKNSNLSPGSVMKRNHAVAAAAAAAAQYRAGNGLATMDPRLTLERLGSSTVSIPAAESLEVSGRSQSSPAVVLSMGGFQDLKLTVGVELAKLYYDICLSGLDVDAIAERAALGEYLSDEE